MLAVTTAAVTLSVSSVAGDCGAQTTQAPPPSEPPRAHRFYIDMRPACRLLDAPWIATFQSRLQVQWTKVANADRYAVAGFAAFGGRLLFAGEVREPPFAVPGEVTEPAAIAVQPRCGPIDGAPSYTVN